MSKYIDLHTHTTISDGVLTPHELLTLAASYNLSVISITDHDSISAYTQKTIKFAAKLNIELVPGIEFSTKDTHGNKYHILGLFIDIRSQALIKLTRKIHKQRVNEIRIMCNKLENLGWTIDADSILIQTKSPTKAHVSRSLIKNPKNKDLLLNTFETTTPTEGMVTESLLIRDKPAFVPTPNDINPQQAIDCIHKAKGLAILAHPSFYILKGNKIEDLFKNFLKLNIDGFEAINIQYDRSNHDKEIQHITLLSKLCQKNGLLITGGSDFHSNNQKDMGKYIDLGFYNQKIKVNSTILKALKHKLPMLN